MIEAVNIAEHLMLLDYFSGIHQGARLSYLVVVYFHKCYTFQMLLKKHYMAYNLASKLRSLLNFMASAEVVEIIFIAIKLKVRKFGK